MQNISLGWQIVSGDGPKTITIHEEGEFTGDISHLTGTPAIFSAIARGDTEVFEITGEALRHVLNQCPSLGDIILHAFIARRQLLRESPDFTGFLVIGSRYSPDTFRIRNFLSKNRVLFTWIDLETDPQVDRLLKQFNVTEAEKIGLHRPLAQTVYDLLVVGAGPAGLAAAVYGASEVSKPRF
jgi:thioredoxin reductase (NADPH)